MAHKFRHTASSLGREIKADSALEYAQTIETVQLPEQVRAAADRYDQVVGDRDRFLWKWIHNLFEEFTLSSVACDAESTARNQKTLLTIFVTTLDDLAELQGDTPTFERARRIPFQRTGDIPEAGDTGNEEILNFLVELWAEITAELEMAPRYEEFESIFEYDFRQTINAMDYSRVLNQTPRMANRAEAERYDAYNMSMFPYACIDLMYSPQFRRRELGALRSLLCELQQMARIGNWLTTWERELAEGDVSSGIVVCALNRGVIRPAEIDGADEATVDRLIDRIKSHGIESEFTREWEIRCRAVRKRTGELESIDVQAIINGLETVMNHHLASDGCK